MFYASEFFPGAVFVSVHLLGLYRHQNEQAANDAASDRLRSFITRLRV
jgi:hypothetical protein